jgi:hypothetical protein
MPSSLIIVALAAAWLVVLVPMVARKRQEIVRTGDAALAARVVRSGAARSEQREEFAMSDNDRDTDTFDDEDVFEAADPDADLEDEVDDVEPGEQSPLARPTERSAGRYRPGRGGFDPEAAEIAARAKYAHRQRVVLGLIAVAVVTAVVAGFLLPVVWWAHGLADLTLVGYLVYLRRQVRIENEIRQRRLSRLGGMPGTERSAHRAEPTAIAPQAAEPVPQAAEPTGTVDAVADVDIAGRERSFPVAERRPTPTSRLRRNAVVVDLDDEDPAFHELDQPAATPYRRAVGE